MRKLVIVKAGDTFEEIIAEHGGFDRWIIDKLPDHRDIIQVIDVEQGEEMPDPSECLGAIMTGSHSMVTEKLEWSEKTAGWIRRAYDADTPFFGICYGHQLMAHALGGTADYNPKGLEIGTVSIDTVQAASDDPLFRGIPATFKAHVIHSQSALRLPVGAVRLAENDHDANHAFRMWRHMWGVQFHPEFNEAVMRGYIDRYQDRLGDQYSQKAAGVSDTSYAEALLRAFALYCTDK